MGGRRGEEGVQVSACALRALYPRLGGRRTKVRARIACETRPGPSVLRPDERELATRGPRGKKCIWA